jgi:hypothetical protein
MGQETSPSVALLVESGTASNAVSVVRGIRRLLTTAVITAVVSSVLITASRGQCYTETGVCVDLKLSASPVLFLGIAIVVFFALDRIITRNLDQFEAARVLTRARLVVKIVAAVAIVVAHVWFALIPMDDFGSRGVNVISPFLFGIIEVTTSAEG